MTPYAGIYRALMIGFGYATYVPVLRRLLYRGTGGTSSARYCYSVWLRHAVMARNAGVWNTPQRIAELGPGDSLGIGLAALLTGAQRYFAFDVVAHADLARNLSILDELVSLVAARADIPDEEEFPRLKPRLDDYAFPGDLFPDDIVDACLAPDRVEGLRRNLHSPRDVDPETAQVMYVVPWLDGSDTASSGGAMESPPVGAALPGSIDMIFSQAVLEHVDDLDAAYRSMLRWLAPAGFMSHQIDFKCHNTAPTWDGHWAMTETVWRLTRGARPYLINRQPCSVHMDLLEKYGFENLVMQRSAASSNLSRGDLAPEFLGLSHEDLTTSGLYCLSRPAPGV